jgi:hypothetical protein
MIINKLLLSSKKPYYLVQYSKNSYLLLFWMGFCNTLVITNMMCYEKLYVIHTNK